jgi:hypothetical protein
MGFAEHDEMVGARRMDPINVSPMPFCQGDLGSIGLSRMRFVRSRRLKPDFRLGGSGE